VISFLADENLKRNIVSGVLRRSPNIDIVRVQDIGLTGLSDMALLEWAAANKRVLLTHDVQTLIGFAWDLVRAHRPMAGVVVVGRRVPSSKAIEDILLIAECSAPDEWSGVVEYLSY
jgi:hypothetical protein